MAQASDQPAHAVPSALLPEPPEVTQVFAYLSGRDLQEIAQLLRTNDVQPQFVEMREGAEVLGQAFDDHAGNQRIRRISGHAARPPIVNLCE